VFGHTIDATELHLKVQLNRSGMVKAGQGCPAFFVSGLLQSIATAK